MPPISLPPPPTTSPIPFSIPTLPPVPVDRISPLVDNLRRDIYTLVPYLVVSI